MKNDKVFDNWHGTTVVSVRKNKEVVIAADGQVTLGDTVIKANARKVRPLANGKVITGFAEPQLTLFHCLNGWNQN